MTDSRERAEELAQSVVRTNVPYAIQKIQYVIDQAAAEATKIERERLDELLEDVCKGVHSCPKGHGEYCCACEILCRFSAAIRGEE